MSEQMNNWNSAREALPTDDQLNELEASVEEARAILTAAEDDLHRAIVSHACVYGWVPTSERFGVAPRVLHSWHRKLSPDVPDLSEVPQREKERQERLAYRLRRQEEKAKAAAEYAEAQRVAAEKQREIFQRGFERAAQAKEA